MEKYDRKKIKLITLVAAFFVVCLVLISVLINILNSGNPYGPQIEIGNFSQYYPSVPKDTKDSLFASLYGIVYQNGDWGEENPIPSAGALIRNGSATQEYNETNQIHYGNFIVDVAEIGQSYAGYFEWAENGNNVSLSGYTVLYTCLKTEQLLYGDFGCTDMFSDTTMTLYPITQKLPLKVEYYADNYTSMTKYELLYEIEDDEVTIIVKDYVGGAYDKAVAKIRELGFNPNDYTIRYENVSSKYTSGYAGD